MNMKKIQIKFSKNLVQMKGFACLNYAHKFNFKFRGKSLK